MNIFNTEKFSIQPGILKCFEDGNVFAIYKINTFHNLNHKWELLCQEKITDFSVEKIKRSSAMGSFQNYVMVWRKRKGLLRLELIFTRITRFMGTHGWAIKRPPLGNHVTAICQVVVTWFYVHLTGVRSQHFNVCRLEEFHYVPHKRYCGKNDNNLN